ncbi:MAG: zf-HC2 domain-containing protein [Pyrinomonadaceae bacterium]
MFTSKDLSTSCSSPDDLVTYLYGEMGDVDRPAFEAHLSECDACTAEFAEMSLARLGVYEWKRDAFASMATPRIVVPYGETAAVSWIDAVRGFFASPAQWATAGGAFVLVALVAGLWFLAVGTTEIATSTRPEPSPRAVNTKPIVIPERPSPPAPAARSSEDVSAPEPSADRAAADDVVPVRTSTKKSIRRSAPRPVKVETAIRPAPAQPARTTPPRLNDFEDDDDDTLRLGDLLAEVETRDE